MPALYFCPVWVVGVLSENGMMNAMVDFLIRIIPSALETWVVSDHCPVQRASYADLYQ